MERIGIIAGTPVDTRMGVDYFNGKGFRASGLPMSGNPREQTMLQALDRDGLTAKTIDSAGRLIRQGCKSIVIYCNSLSGAIDMDRLKQGCDANVITPLDIYRRISGDHSHFGVLAANCQSLAGIERTILGMNREAIVTGYCCLSIVQDVERGDDPHEIISRHSLIAICDGMSRAGAARIILGCTHFTHLHKALEKETGRRMIEPSEEMASLIRPS